MVCNWSWTVVWIKLNRSLVGEDLERLSLRDVVRLEQQLRDNLGRIHAKKVMDQSCICILHLSYRNQFSLLFTSYDLLFISKFATANLAPQNNNAIYTANVYLQSSRLLCLQTNCQICFLYVFSMLLKVANHFTCLRSNVWLIPSAVVRKGVS